jgi:ectoine hydroxylase-related dioxygenase (phytanoyl-CoA dioxygenase family)
MSLDAPTDEETFQHFREHGWMRVRAAFSADEAEAMRTVVWRALADVGIRQDDPATWARERPEHLQHLKADPVFQAVGSSRLLKAIDAAFEGQAYARPKHWGAFFLAFPSRDAWNVPAGGWHIDANYVSSLSPPDGVRTHVLFGDVAPRAGGTLIVSGSHRLVHKYFRDHPPAHGTRGVGYRRLLQGHPYIGELHAEGSVNERVARFMDRTEEHDGISLRIVENTGAAGDVILLHPLVLHVATPNTGHRPRFLLSGGIDLPSMWAA